MCSCLQVCFCHLRVATAALVTTNVSAYAFASAVNSVVAGARPSLLPAPLW